MYMDEAPAQKHTDSKARHSMAQGLNNTTASADSADWGEAKTPRAKSKSESGSMCDLHKPNNN